MGIVLPEVATLDEAGLSYAFHMIRAWREPSGEIVWAEDSGCSCPSPFENEHWNSESDTSLERSKVDLRRAVDGFRAGPLEKRAFLEACGIGGP